MCVCVWKGSECWDPKWFLGSDILQEVLLVRLAFLLFRANSWLLTKSSLSLFVFVFVCVSQRNVLCVCWISQRTVIGSTLAFYNPSNWTWDLNHGIRSDGYGHIGPFCVFDWYPLPLWLLF